MQRQLMSELIAWKSRTNRKPLLLKGARQTGKTWLLNEFASQQYRNVIRFDFMLEPSTRSLFDGDLDPKRIISQIELLRGQTVTPADTLIIFDEIQEAPRGITSLKYFNELAPEYHIVAAGSYMGLALRRENESFPVGKIDQLTMRPMGFAEFVRAVDGDPLADAILAADMNLLANVTEKLEHLLKEYLVVGGMPEVVSAFAETRDFIEARRLQQQIIEAYESDFGKHAPARIIERMRLVWKSLPGQLAKENKKFVYGALRPGARARDFEESLQWLTDYGIVHKVPRVSALKAPLSSYEDLSSEKPRGSTRCRQAPVTTQVRPILPVLAGISGAYSTMLNMNLLGSERKTTTKGTFVVVWRLRRRKNARLDKPRRGASRSDRHQGRR